MKGREGKEKRKEGRKKKVKGREGKEKVENIPSFSLSPSLSSSLSLVQ